MIQFYTPNTRQDYRRHAKRHVIPTKIQFNYVIVNDIRESVLFKDVHSR